MDYIVDPQEIERKSMEIISGLIGPLNCSPEEEAIVKRIVHTTGDPEYAKLIRIHPQAIQAGLTALRAGCTIFTDVNMVLTGINKGRMSKHHIQANCAIAHEQVVQIAKETGETRAITAMKYFGEQLTGSIVAIGNAPTALFQLLKMIDDQEVRPALIIGTPVGFVGAAESKELLVKYDVPYVTVTGYKGGSAVAAAAINALMIQLG